MNFGYTINRPRAIDIDRNDMKFSVEFLRRHPLLQTCIACGNCAATCTAANFTTFSFRRVQTLARRGEYAGLRAELDKCMLCGKCRLSCPRGINTREIVIALKKHLPKL